ncbi:MAG: hypothetical protein WC155_03975 [Candidatus Cloacimonadales bacterium]
MNDLIMREVIKEAGNRNNKFDDSTIHYLADRINAILDIPLLNEEMEKIIIQAVLRIIFSLLFAKQRITINN